MLLTWPQSSGLNGVLNSAAFYLPFNDLGAGLVDTGVYAGTGPATFTRATTKWTKLSTGLWASIASGSAAFSYIGQDTTVTTGGGYFAEAAGTQLVTPTASIRDMTNAAWVKVNLTAAKTSTGIDGVAASCSRLTATAGNGTILQTLVAAATTRTYSCFIKRITGTGEIDISEDGSTWTNVTASINSSTFTRVSVTTSQLNAAFGIRIVTSGDAIDVDFNQFESGTYATSPMDAAGAARNADILNYPSTGNIDFTQGTCYAEVSTLWTTSAAGNNEVVNTSNGFMLVAGASQVSTQIRINDNTTTVAKTGLTDMATGARKRTSSWGATGMSITGDGLAVATGIFDGSMGTTSLFVGSTTGSAAQWDGTIRNLRIWTKQLPDNTLQALTA